MLWKRLFVVFVILISLAGAMACDSEGPAEKAGEQIDEAAEEARENTGDALEKAGDKIEEMGDKVEDATD